MTRTEFRDAVFTRDGHKCVVCGAPAQDAHHIIERRLFHDGGYDVDNGVSLCGECHIRAEQTLLTVEELRDLAGIRRKVMPDCLYDDQVYDKWGNPVFPGRRGIGPLFHDESVQKILAAGNVLGSFTAVVKYPRTCHLPWSPGMHEDDRMLHDLSGLVGSEVVVTEKMDGENTTMYWDHIHARSVDGRDHPSRHWVKGLWSRLSMDIPYGWRVCGENLYARHSIPYDALPSYFMAFSIWNDKNVCLGWDESVEWFKLLGLEHVPVLYRGQFDEQVIRKLWTPDKHDSMEGYVVRPAQQFHFSEFHRKVGKFVRPNHVQTTKHWMYGQPLEKNETSRSAQESNHLGVDKRAG